MYCQDCNTGNTVDSKYCKECGAKINSGYRTMMLSIQDLPLGQSDEAVERLTRLLDMAFWHNQAGNSDAAITAAEAALALNPHSTTAHSLLGTLYEKQGDDGQAIRHFESVLSLNPESQADAAKLDQLRRGVHVRAVAPPLAHQWVPPVFLRFRPQLQQKWSSLAVSSVSAKISEFKLTELDPQRRPFCAAGAATALVAALGLLATHPWAQAETEKSYPVSAPAPAAVNRSAFAAGTQSALLPPVVLQAGRPNYTVPNYLLPAPARPAITANDPFAGPVPSTSPASVAAAPLWSLPPVRRSAEGRSAASSQALPPLRLAALPAESSGRIAPAPIALPIGGISAAGPGTLPQHTVVVSSFGGTPVSAAASFSPEPTSHIRITVHQAPDRPAPDYQAAPADTSAVTSAVSASVPISPAGDSGRQGESYQQRALSLQEAGSFSQARLAYRSAIRSYQAQIASGQDVVTAQRGLAACQTGLEICDQSQP